MFKIFEEDKMQIPVKVWLDNQDDIEKNCLEQACRLAEMPFLHKWICLMPDTHAGVLMPVGGVIAAEGIVIPCAVGVDIGCGMAYSELDINLQEIKEIMTGNGSLIQAIIGDIMRNIPVGFEHHKKAMRCNAIDQALCEIDLYQRDTELSEKLAEGYYQIGTLGGGNHFIELQADDAGGLAIMLHSGSRHFGKTVCDYFDNRAKEINGVENSLPFLSVDSREGKQYLNWMKLSMEFAKENREKILETVKEIVSKWILKYTGRNVTFSNDINCHHNYASFERHFDKDLWIHRKGAVSARTGELAVIPGAMGSYSYVVRGKGNPESFCSSSHGAGRAYSRRGAMDTFRCEQVMEDLKKHEVILGKKNKSDVAEECRFAYKDIEVVMERQRDLVEPVKRLRTVGVIKG